MIQPLVESLCRVYTIPCPACGTDNPFPRYRRDVCRASSSEPDGHPLAVSFSAEGEFPVWAGPLTFFWGCCPNCNFSGQVDDGDFRQWKKKNTTKYLAGFHDGALDDIKTQGLVGMGPLGVLKKGLSDQDMYLRLLSQFYSGIFTETLKTAPVAGTLGRSYLRVAWIFRDTERLYSEFDTKPAQDLLAELKPVWDKNVRPNSSYALVPSIAVNEAEALRFASAYFEWNFQTLSSSSGIEDEMRLMSLIAEMGYRIYELTGDEDDFRKAQNRFSGTMQKCLSVVNDKSIVGGAVNRAKDTLEKAGDRGRELIAVRDNYDKNGKPDTAPTLPPPAPAAPKAVKPAEAPAEASKETASNEAAPAAPPPADVNGSGASLQEKVEQLDKENRRWMRLAGMSELTGLPNRVMLNRVLLPGLFKAVAAKRQPLGCILISPEGVTEINGKYGREFGDQLIKEFTDCLKSLARNGERLLHLESVNFALLSPNLAEQQLRKRADGIHKELSFKRFTINGETLSIGVSIGFSAIQSYTGTPKNLQEGLYKRSIQALDNAKAKGSKIEYIQQS
jgi:diguanylate cyclase (GGDEF)-like protein